MGLTVFTTLAVTVGTTPGVVRSSRPPLVALAFIALLLLFFSQ